LRMCEASVAVSRKLWPRHAAVSPKLWPHYVDYRYTQSSSTALPASRGPASRGGLADRRHVDSRVAHIASEAGNIKGCGKPGGDLTLVRTRIRAQTAATALRRADLDGRILVRDTTERGVVLSISADAWCRFTDTLR